MADQLTPTTARSITVTAPGGSLAALDADPGGPAPMLLLIPGYTGSKEDFAPILDGIAAARIHGLAVDLPGQYESPGPDDERSYTPAALGAVVAGLVVDLAAGGRPVVLLGHSFGGLVARGAVLAGAPVAGLVLLGSGPGGFTSGSRLAAIEAGEPVLRAHGAAAVYAAQAAARSPDTGSSAAVAEFLRARFLSTAPAALLGMGAALRSEPDRVAELAAVLRQRRAGVAVIAGVADDAWPLTDQAAMAVRLGTELVLVPGAGHSPALDAPETLLRVLLPLVRDWTAGAHTG